jgi:hypothetical protein
MGHLRKPGRIGLGEVARSQNAKAPPRPFRATVGWMRDEGVTFAGRRCLDTRRVTVHGAAPRPD